MSMGMNIGSMLRAFMGNAAPAEGKTLELRIGQIVRGILMEMLDNGDALMNINGVSVRARLEAELQVGRGTLLQVQPGSNGATIVLKPLADAADIAPDEALKNVLKQFGLPDQKWSYELLRGLRRDGYALDSGTASFFREAASARPAAADPSGWAGAADVAFRRGLNATEGTLTALRQTLFGQPLHEQLNAFTSAFRQWLGDAAATGAGKLPEWAAGLQRLLADGERLLAQGSAQLAGEAARSAPAARGELPAQPGQAPAGGQPAVPAETAARSAAALAAAPTAAAAAQTASAAPAPQAAAAAARLAQGGLAAELATAPLPSGEAAKNPGTGSAAARSPAAEAAVVSQRAEANRSAADPAPSALPRVAQEAAGAAGQAAQRGGDSWIGRFLQWLGAGHENQLLQAAADGRALPPQGLPTAMQAPGGEPAQAQQQAADSLKSALLLLAASDEAPPALREAAQSLANHITGQQLLLSSERQNSQPYSFMTMFVPMKGQDGDTTATVHVQTRRSRKGEWDADNCRLLFDLRMRHLGSTVVDVQVVDRIVSLKLLNDHPDMADLVEQAREELNAGLRDAGFHLLSLKVQPFPIAQEAAVGEPAERLPAMQSASEFASKPYRGVDFRV